MSGILVYKKEIELGLAEKIQANASIAYCHQAMIPSENRVQKILENFHKSIASSERRNQPDLFYLDTILVTTGQNRNYDIFDPAETWLARSTAEDKPFNYGHVQSDIIGHITGNFCVDDDYMPLDDALAMEDIPDKFHILTSAVIYKAWEDKEQAKRINKVIAEIAEGKWYVSMECLFRGFDYGLTTSAGEFQCIARNAETSFLTKHLRQYGGDGEYNGCAIGRVLRNITFSGKGLVEKPANPESIIFNEVTKATFKMNFDKDVYKSLLNLDNSKGEIVMPENSSDTITISKAEFDSLKLKADSATAKVITELETSLKASKEETEKEKKAKEKAEAEVTAAKDEAAKEKKDKEKAEADLAQAKKELDAEKETIKEYKRAAAYIAKTGKSEDEAKAFVKVWATASDEQFNSVLDLVVADKKNGDVLDTGKKATIKGKTEEETKDGKATPLTTVKADVGPADSGDDDKVVKKGKAADGSDGDEDDNKSKKAKAAKKKNDDDDEEDDEDDSTEATEKVLASAQPDKSATLGSTSTEIESTRASLGNYFETLLSKNRKQTRTNKK